MDTASGVGGDAEPTSADALTADQASQLLHVVHTDQTATRVAATPPSWFFVAMPIVVTIAIAANAIPVDWISLVVLAINMVAAITSLVVMLRRRAVRVEPFVVLKPFWPAALPWLAIWAVVVIVCLAMMIPLVSDAIVWWAWIVIGLVVGFGLYLVASRSWRRWAMEAPHAP